MMIRSSSRTPWAPKRARRTPRTRRVLWAALTAGLLSALVAPLATSAPAGAAPVYCLGRIATIVGTNGNDALDGTAAADVIAGLDGNDVIRGFGGNDVLCGGEGTNIFDGGADHDVMTGGGGDDSFYGNDGEDEVTYQDSAFPIDASLLTRSASGAGHDVFSAIENLSGSPWNDFLVGDDGPNRLVGGNGSDYLLAYGGSDIIADGGIYASEVNQFSGGAGSDIYYGAAGRDVANFQGSLIGVTVDLTAGTATGEGSDLLSGMDDVIGTTINDVIRGDADPNVLNGNGGDDRISGEGGNDTIIGGSDNDQMDGGPGTDQASYEDAFGPIVANLATGTATGEGTDTLTSIESLRGGAAADELTGGPANDTIEGGPGNDRLDGGGGTSDVAAFDHATAGVRADLQTGTATGDGSDTLVRFEGLRGGTQPDVLRGDAAANRIVGGPSDEVEGRQGDDTLELYVTSLLSYRSATGPVTVDLGTKTASGAAGADVLVGDPHYVMGGPFADRITCAPNAYCNLSGGAGNDVLTGSSAGDGFTGGSGNDRIVGKGGPNKASFSGTAAVNVDLVAGTATGQGTDTLSGIALVQTGTGNDTVRTAGLGGCEVSTDAGNDRITITGSAPCRIYAGAGDDNVVGGAGNDFVQPYTGRDVVDAGAGDDEVAVYDSGDTVNGGAGLDFADLRYGPAALQIDLKAGTVTGGWTMTLRGFEQVDASPYADTIRGTDGADDIYGYLGNDTIIGRGGNDVLGGGDGTDLIYGLEGDDTLDGGLYSDTLFGGPGTDTVTFSTASGQGVKVNLVTGTAEGYGETDQIRELENIVGSYGPDVLTGDAGPNVIDGKEGTDTCTGGGGTDTLQNCP